MREDKLLVISSQESDLLRFHSITIIQFTI